MRREYRINIEINGIALEKVIIDPHYEEKHAESINDEVILRLIGSLNSYDFLVETYKQPYSYFVTDRIELAGCSYKLIWLLEDNENYIGVINAYRRS